MPEAESRYWPDGGSGKVGHGREDLLRMEARGDMHRTAGVVQLGIMHYPASTRACRVATTVVKHPQMLALCNL